jgi:hypothetical protein
MKSLAGRLYSVAAPEQPGAPEQFFMALHGLLRPALRRMTEGQPWVSLELGGLASRDVVEFEGSEEPGSDTGLILFGRLRRSWRPVFGGRGAWPRMLQPPLK